MHLYLTFIYHDKSNNAGVRMWISLSKQHSLCGEYSERIRICVCLRIYFILNLVYTCSVFPFSIKSAMCSIYIRFKTIQLQSFAYTNMLIVTQTLSRTSSLLWVFIITVMRSASIPSTKMLCELYYF
jgi:hypothetical protein